MAERGETLWDYMAWLRDHHPRLYNYYVKDSEGREAFKDLALQAAREGWAFWRFWQQIQATTYHAAWVDAGQPSGPPTEDEIPEEGTEEEGEEEGDDPDAEPGDAEPTIDEDVRDLLKQFLVENELPLTLMTFIEDALSQNMSFSEIVLRLRETPEYLAAYPENALRAANGFSWMPEAEIRAYRDEARRLAEQYFGVGASNDEIANLIAQNKSLAEWERELQVLTSMERWGPVVRQLFESELGYQIDDERLFAFMHPDIPTPELDRAYELALMRGQPALIGLGIRPEEEAELLRSFGLSPEETFRGYQQLGAELPRAERLAAIEAEINRNGSKFPPSTGLFGEAPFSLLFKGIFLSDPDAILQLQQQMAREISRFQAGGGPVRSGTQTVGLLTAGERQAQ